MSASTKFAKIVQWSDEDQCFVGSAPGLIYGGCHGDDERIVFGELCQIVEDVVALYEADGKTLPEPTYGLIDKLNTPLDGKQQAAECNS